MRQEAWQKSNRARKYNLHHCSSYLEGVIQIQIYLQGRGFINLNIKYGIFINPDINYFKNIKEKLTCREEEASATIWWIDEKKFIAADADADADADAATGGRKQDSKGRGQKACFRSRTV